MALGKRCAALVAIIMLAASTRAEFCGVDSTNPESMNCNGAEDFGNTLFTTTKVSLKAGLSYAYYQKTCPSYLTTIQTMVNQAVQASPSQAAGLLRIMFHDCFIQGCDASILVTSNNNDEQTAVPNLSLRQESLQLLTQIKAKLEQICPKTVSCADILSVATAHSVSQVRGPTIKVPVGRRDSNNFESANFVTSHLPSPFNNVSANLPEFTAMGLDAKDFVALSGAHTLGQAHCSSFSGRLSPVLDPELDANFGKQLQQQCPSGSGNSVNLDTTPNVFDNLFFKQILTGDVLLHSDASMELDSTTVGLVRQFAKSNSRFFSQFATSFVKMSQLNVLTGTSGEVRSTCSAINVNSS